MRVSKLARPGPIIIAIWLICYLIWAFFLPYEWIRAIRKFLFEEHLEPKIIKSLGLPADSISSLPLSILFLILGIFLLVLLAGFKWRALRDLFQ
jgi:hypothetical protein